MKVLPQRAWVCGWVLLSIYLGLLPSTQAADPVWNGPSGTTAVPGTAADWAVGGNWIEGVKPTTTTTATINNGGTAFIVTTEFARGLFLGNGSGQSGNLLLTTDSSNPDNIKTGSLVVAGDYTFVGDFGTGRITINGGADLTTQKTYVATDPGGSGYVTVSGTGSTWTITDNSGEFQIGSSGHGEVLIENGGFVTANNLIMGNDTTLTPPGAHGILTIDGAGSTYSGAGIVAGQVKDGDIIVKNSGQLTLTGQLNLGLFGNAKGNLQLLSGGKANTNSAFLAGQSATSTGTALIDGTNSLWTITGTLNVASAGTGAVTISNGGKVTNTTASTIGSGTAGNGKVTVTGGNAEWVNSNSLTIAGSGSTGVLEILDGGYVSNTNATVGAGTGATVHGSATISGVNATTLEASTWAIAGNLIVGSSAQFVGSPGSWGEVNISSGGIVNVRDGVYAGSISGKTSTINVTGAGSQLNYNPSQTDVSNFHLGLNANSTVIMNVLDGADVTGSDSITTGPPNNTSTQFNSLEIGSHQTSTATVNVSGAGSTWWSGNLVSVGELGTGFLNILGGGHFTGGELEIGAHQGSSGTVTVSGADSTLVIGTTNPNPLIQLGYGGTGKLDILAGGAVQTVDIQVGGHLLSFIDMSVLEDSYGEGTLKISGTKSKLTSTGETVIGFLYNGSLLIESGGVLDSTSTNFLSGGVSIGYDDGITGTAIIRNAGSRLDTKQDLAVGANGTGILTVSDGAQITSEDGWIGQFASTFDPNPANHTWSNGTVTMSDEGTKWTLTGELDVAFQGNGTLTVESGADVAVGTQLIVGSTNTSTGVTNIQGANTVVTANSMRIAPSTPGAGSGKVNLSAGGELNVANASVINAMGELHIGIGGLAGKFASGSVVNNGLLEFNHTDDYVYNIATSGSAGGKVVKKGSGRTDVGGNNTFSGAVSIEGGAFRATSNTALGNTTGGTVVKSGASLELAGGLAIGAETLELSGTGVSGGGALRSVEGDNTFGGMITITLNSAIAVLADSLGLAGDIDLSSQKLVLDGAGNLVLQGNITGSGDLEKTGSGKVTITSSTLYTGNFTVKAGELALNGSLAEGSEIFVENGAVLSGNGTADEINLLAGGFLRPGQSPGTLHGEDLFWTGDGVLEYELGDASSETNSDLLVLEDGLAKVGEGEYLFRFSDGIGLPTLGGTYTLITFNSLTDFEEDDFSWEYIGSLDGFDGAFLLEANALKFVLVPEPGAAGLLALAAAGFLIRRRRRR